METKSIRIAVVIHALHSGGAERITAQLASHWARRGHDVTLITLDSVQSDLYQVDARVKRIGLDLMRTSRNRREAVSGNLRRLRCLRRAVRAVGPACVVSVTDRMNVMTLLACRGLEIPVVVAEQIDPRHQTMPQPWEWLRTRTYRHATVAVALTNDIAQHLRTRWRVPTTRVIPNGVELPGQMIARPPGQREKRIVAMGRLNRQKGFDRLISAFAEIAAEWPDWKLRILGEGAERAALETQCVKLGLQTRVELPGWVNDPWAELGSAALFVLSSRYEGFPVVLLEAMACGTPVVCFDCQSGPAEIVRPNIDGVLVPPDDVTALRAAIASLLEDPARRQTLGTRAREVIDRFSLAKLYTRWDSLLEELINR